MSLTSLSEPFLVEAGLARQVELSDGDGQPVLLSSLLERPAVILLGDPGIGKSVTIRAAALAAGAERQTVRAFLTLGAGRQHTGSVFLDALDEMIASRRSVTPLDEVAGLLQSMGWPRFWLSCRPADWAQAGGRTLLEECVPGGLMIARLLPLSDGQIAAVIKAKGLEPDVVMDSMEQAGLLALLGNPETLRLTAEVFADGGPPASRTDLYHRATRQLAREANREHARRAGRPSNQQLLDAAGALSALLLLSGRPAIAAPGLDTEHAIPFETCEGLAPRDYIEAALGSRLFQGSGDEAWEPAHRTIAEFLGAEFLASQISQRGQPLGRTLALICGEDATPEPSLRGLFAWLSVLLPDRAEEFVGRDPYAVATYGDLAGLRVGGRRALVVGLHRLVEAEPYFRAGQWHEARFGALAVPDLVPELRQIVAMRPVHPHLLSCILDALEAGAPRPELAPDLATLITDADVDHDVRDAATAAFVKVTTEAAAIALFRQLLRDDAADPRAHLAGRLLLRLYPRALGADDVAAFLDRFISTDKGRGDRLHVAHRLPQLCPSGQEAALLDRLSALGWASQRSDPLTRLSEVKQVARVLAARALTGPELITSARAVAWLPLLAGDGRDTRDAESLKAALAARPDLYITFLLAARHMVREGNGDQPWNAPWRLRRVLPWFDPPHDAPGRLIDAVEADPDGEAAVVLYASSFMLMLEMPDAGSIVFERAWKVGDLRPALRQQRDDALSCPMEGQQWRREDRERAAQHAREEAETAARDAAFFDEHIDAIRTGMHVHALGCLATWWFGYFLSAGGEAPPDPRDRLRLAVQPHVASAAEAGFRAYVAAGPVLNPKMIARQAVENSRPYSNLAALAGADLLYGDAGSLTDGLDAERCAGLLCLGLVQRTQTTIDGVTRTDDRPWLRHLAEVLPAESERAVRELLTEQIAAGAQSVDGLHEICDESGFEAIRRRLVPELLAKVCAPSTAFDTLRQAAAKDEDPTALGAIVNRRLQDAHAVLPEKRWPWLLLAWRLSPEEHEQALVDAYHEDEGLISALTQDVGDERDGFDGDLRMPLTVRHRLTIVRIAGPRFQPAPMPEGTWSPPTPYDRARFVRRHIDGIGDAVGPEADAALQSLLADPSLAAHGDNIRHALSVWRRNARLERREVPPLPRLVRALMGGPPATVAELHSFVVAHLEGLRDALRVTSDNAWRAFWNVDARTGPTEARPENDCRDAIKRFLDARFERAGLVQETEVRHVGDTRCDITVGGIDAVVPIEVKCDWNPSLWTAWQDQLRTQYACDPRAEGFGIYLVIWFGEQRGRKRRVASSPTGPAPVSAAECQDLLEALMAEHASRLIVVTIDASPV